MSAEITHKARVTAIHIASISVVITSKDKCQGCRVAVVCGSSDDRVLQEIGVDDPQRYSSGDEVIVTATDASLWYALSLGIILPCVTLLAGILVMIALGASQTVAAASALGFTAVYYLILYLFRKRIPSKLKWRVSPMNTLTDK